MIEPFAKDVLFSIIHNNVPNRERLFTKMHMVNSPICKLCGVREFNTHIFTECVLVSEAWGWMRMRLLGLLSPGRAVCSNFEIINVIFDKYFMDMEAVW